MRSARTNTAILASAILFYQSVSFAEAFAGAGPKHTVQRTIKQSVTNGPLFSALDQRQSNSNPSRRDILQKGSVFGTIAAATLTTQVPVQSAAYAKNIKSRTTGYSIQHTEAEWSELLSKQQYFILREGGTESPYSSILEGEERAGVYSCSGCQTPLFDAKEKFHSGTGWPSFAYPLMSSADSNVSNVEMEDMSAFQYKLAGAEVRCHSCGGHLGDVFADGFLFVGTPAAKTGQRYCIDGAALLFAPQLQKSSEKLEIVRGDLPPRNGQRPVFLG